MLDNLPDELKRSIMPKIQKFEINFKKKTEKCVVLGDINITRNFVVDESIPNIIDKNSYKQSDCWFNIHKIRYVLLVLPSTTSIFKNIFKRYVKEYIKNLIKIYSDDRYRGVIKMYIKNIYIIVTKEFFNLFDNSERFEIYEIIINDIDNIIKNPKYRYSDYQSQLKFLKYMITGLYSDHDKFQNIDFILEIDGANKRYLIRCENSENKSYKYSTLYWFNDLTEYEPDYIGYAIGAIILPNFIDQIKKKNSSFKYLVIHNLSNRNVTSYAPYSESIDIYNLIFDEFYPKIFRWINSNNFPPIHYSKTMFNIIENYFEDNQDFKHKFQSKLKLYKSENYKENLFKQLFCNLEKFHNINQNYHVRMLSPGVDMIFQLKQFLGSEDIKEKKTIVYYLLKTFKNEINGVNDDGKEGDDLKELIYKALPEEDKYMINILY